MPSETEKVPRWHTDYAGQSPAEKLANRREECLEHCPEHVRDLLKFLSDSGTGVSKLEALAQIATKTKSLELFVERAARLVPDGTIEKINDYINTKRMETKSEEVIKGDKADQEAKAAKVEEANKKK